MDSCPMVSRIDNMHFLAKYYMLTEIQLLFFNILGHSLPF